MKCFHHNDMDGRCAAAVVAEYFNDHDPADFIECDYSGIDIDVISEGETVVIVNLSFTEKTLDTLLRIIDKSEDVYWIDHHDSSIAAVSADKNFDESVRGYLRYYLSKEASGAALAYMYFYDCYWEDVPLFIRLVSDYDNWDKESIYSDSFMYGLVQYEQSPVVSGNVWEDLFNEYNFASTNPSLDVLDMEFIIENTVVEYPLVYSIIHDGEVVEKYLYVNDRSTVDSIGFESSLCGLRCFCVNARRNSQLFGDKIREYPLLVSFVYDGDKYRYSIYSEDPGVDCSKIAETFGGGGHKSAAGFTTSYPLF